MPPAGPAGHMPALPPTHPTSLADLKGWVNDVTLLRKQIAAVDRRLRQQAVVGRLRDDERRDAILDKHYRCEETRAWRGGPVGGVARWHAWCGCSRHVNNEGNGGSRTLPACPCRRGVCMLWRAALLPGCPSLKASAAGIHPPECLRRPARHTPGWRPRWPAVRRAMTRGWTS